MIQHKLNDLFEKCEPFILIAVDKILRSQSLRRLGIPFLDFANRHLHLFPGAEVVSTERAVKFIDAARLSGRSRISLGPCACQETLGCRTHIKELTVLCGDGVCEAGDGSREIGPDEARRLLENLRDEGCIHSFFSCKKSDGLMAVICACDDQICVPFRVHQIMGGILMPGPDTIDYRRDRCNGCGRCIERCPFDANRLLDGGCIDIDMIRCYGCGICVPTCPRGARRLVQREGYSSQFYPLEFVKNGGQQRDQEHLLCEIRNR